MGAPLAQRATKVRLHDLPTFDPPGWRVITIAMQKGGVGKTATSGGLGVQLSAAGVPVVMIDLCHTGALTESFGLSYSEDDANIATLMTGEWDGSIYDLAVPVRENLWLIPASVDSVVLAEDLQQVKYREERLRGALRDDELGALPERAVVIIDCPPILSLVTDNALLACASERGDDEQLGGLLLTPELLKKSLKTLDLLMQQVKALEGKGRFSVNVLGWFASASDGTKATVRAQDALKELPQYERLGEMPRRTNIKDARDEGRPLLDAFPKSDANEVHKDLAGRIRRKIRV